MLGRGPVRDLPTSVPNGNKSVALDVEGERGIQEVPGTPGADSDGENEAVMQDAEATPPAEVETAKQATADGIDEKNIVETTTTQPEQKPEQKPAPANEASQPIPQAEPNNAAEAVVTENGLVPVEIKAVESINRIEEEDAKAKGDLPPNNPDSVETVETETEKNEAADRFDAIIADKPTPETESEINQPMDESHSKEADQPAIEIDPEKDEPAVEVHYKVTVIFPCA